MRWSAIDPLLTSLSVPSGLTLARLASDEIAEVPAALCAWHPDLEIGEEPFLLTDAFYRDEVALRDVDGSLGERPACALRLRDDHGLAALLVLEHQAGERALLGTISVVAPRWRGRGLGRVLIQATDVVAGAIGVDLVYGFTELENVAQGRILESEGYWLCGLIPDSERRRIAPGLMRNVPEALYIKPRLPAERLLWPDPRQLSPRALRMFRLLDFPGTPAALTAHPAATPEPLGAVPPVAPAVAARLARPDHTWPDVAVLSEQLDLPAGFRIRGLARADIPRVIEQVASWFPDLRDSVRAFLLDPAYYEEQVALDGEDQDYQARPGHVFTVWDRDALVLVTCARFDEDGSTLLNDFAALDPRYRRQGIGDRVMPLLGLIGRAMGIETVLGWSTLRHPAAQRAVERGGWQLWGLIPASERYRDGGVDRGGFEALYGASLVPAEQSYWPPLDTLPPRLAALCRLVRDDGGVEAGG